MFKLRATFKIPNRPHSAVSITASASDIYDFNFLITFTCFTRELICHVKLISYVQREKIWQWQKRNKTQNVNLINFNYFSVAALVFSGVCYDRDVQDTGYTQGCWINIVGLMSTHVQPLEVLQNGL